jgi:hypothetical protein
MLVALDSPTALRLLRIYGINAPVSDERFTGDPSYNAGIPVTIDGILQPGPSIRVKIGTERASRSCPVAQADAAGLVRELHEANALRSDQKWDTALIQLIVKSSKLFLDSAMGEFHLVLYLTPQGYRTHAVYMMRTRRAPVTSSRGSV